MENAELLEPAGDSGKTTYPFATWSPMVALAGAVIALLAGVVIGLPFFIAQSPDAGQDLSLLAKVAIQICTAVGFIIVPVALASHYGGGLRASMRRLGFVSFKAGSAAKWIGIGILAYFAFAIVFMTVFGRPEQEDIAGDFGPIGLQILLIVFLAPFAEEICFRGMLFGGLRTKLPLWAAALGAGLFFGLLHYSTGPSAVPSLVALGVIFAVVYEKTESIWPPIIMHVVNNSFALIVLTAS
ncbi:MAG: type II CAAX endopeptidase family protein [Solirubrobacterales bacterium]